MNRRSLLLSIMVGVCIGLSIAVIENNVIHTGEQYTCPIYNTLFVKYIGIRDTYIILQFYNTYPKPVYITGIKIEISHGSTGVVLKNPQVIQPCERKTISFDLHTVLWEEDITCITIKYLDPTTNKIAEIKIYPITKGANSSVP